MAIEPGHVGNLTPEQEAKLRDFWVALFKIFDVKDEQNRTPPAPTVSAEAPAPAKRGSFWGRKADPTPAEDDKYGQSAEFQGILSKVSPETLRSAFWVMLKQDHPDALLLRFLRARKWDVNKALAMLISTGQWRVEEVKIDDDIMLHGEANLLRDEKSMNSEIKKEAEDFLRQLRIGKSFCHGADKDGRPLTYIRVRLHHGSDQTVKSLERYTLHNIETSRLLLKSPVETAGLIFDLTNFSLANMDYTPVKFMIKVFEANYPESLGVILIHRAPWIFQGIWKVIKGWLDPVVAAKVNFTNNATDLEAFIPKSQIIKELGGEEDWEYSYIEPVEGENKLMEDTATRDKIAEERASIARQHQQKTFDWIHASADPAAYEKLAAERQDLYNKLSQNYWQLDPYVRARSLYDRQGMIQPGGKIDFYPPQPKKAGAVAEPAVAAA